MQERTYKKMAGTSAVFITADYSTAWPMGRDGLVWTDVELHMPIALQPIVLTFLMKI